MYNNKNNFNLIKWIRYTVNMISNVYHKAFNFKINQETRNINTYNLPLYLTYFHMVKGLFLHILYIRYVYISLVHPRVLKVLSACKDNFCKDAASSVAVWVFRTLDLGSMYHSACQRLGSKVPMSWKTAKYKSMPWNYRKIEWNFDN